MLLKKKFRKKIDLVKDITIDARPTYTNKYKAVTLFERMKLASFACNVSISVLPAVPLFSLVS